MDDREVLIDKLRMKEELDRRLADERLRIYIPNSDKHIDFHYSDASIKAFLGGNRTGKTVAGAIEACLKVLGRDSAKYTSDWTDKWIEHSDNKESARLKLKDIVERYSNSEPQSGWIASVSYKSQVDGCQQALLDFLPKTEIKDIAYISRAENIISKINLINGRSITFKSYEQGYQDFQSAGMGWIWFDEEPPEMIWKESSVRQKAGVPLKRFLTMTPVHGLSFVYDLIYLNKLNNPDIYKVQIGWKDNPHLTKEQVDSMSYGLTEDELKVRRDGDFVQPVGLVYKNFKPIFHVVPHFEPDKDKCSFHRSFDFGFAEDHPFVSLMFAIDPDGCVYVFNELYLTETGQDEIIRRVKEESKPYQFRVSYADSARPDWIDAFDRNGIPTEKASKDVEAGIAKVQEYLAINPFTGKPRLVISTKCQRLINEFTRYSWDEKSSDGRGKRLPAKKWDDGLDALRYFLFTYTLPYSVVKQTVEKTYDSYGRPVYKRTSH